MSYCNEDTTVWAFAHSSAVTVVNPCGHNTLLIHAAGMNTDTLVVMFWFSWLVNGFSMLSYIWAQEFFWSKKSSWSCVCLQNFSLLNTLNISFFRLIHEDPSCE